MTCRHCAKPLTKDGAVFLDLHNRPTKTPACRDCYEKSIVRTDKPNQKLEPLQYVPGRAQREYEGGYVE